MSKAIPFDSLVVGEELGTWSVDVTEEAVRAYCDDWDDHNPLYLRGTEDGGPPVAPPAFMAGLTGFRLLRLKYDSSSTLGAKTQHENIRPIHVGDTLRTVGRLADKYLKRGLEYVIIESISYNNAGEVVRTSRDHIVLGLDRVEETRP
ncbi:MAG: MaoC family dehydratase N-terminal domain-containing protein [Acetobacteraceae bacterium]|nr:MaoC family dehydratase N-terminal domain-containing protein [Acetobacteraceae bacterium]